MEWPLLLLVVVVIVVFLFKNKFEKSTNFPYEQLPCLFTAAERSFLGVLNQAINEDTIVMGKVRMADVIRPRKGLSRQAWGKAFGRISSKHFDFLLCDAKDLSVKAVIELDDSSHSQKKRKDRDEFVKNACSAVGLALHRIKASTGYNVSEIRSLLYPEVESNSEVILSKPNEKESITITPKENEEQKIENKIPEKPGKVCPQCSSELVVKVAKRGKYKGNSFLACSAYPNCKYISKIEG